MPSLKSALTVTILGFASGSLATSDCKCYRQDKCWPGQDDWSKFNSSINGQLIHARPPGSVCYKSESDYDPVACKKLFSEWNLSTFHLQDPISIDYPFWADDACPPIFPNGTSIDGDPSAGNRGCTLGKYPVYVVNATGPEDIATSVKWAKEKNLRLNVKNTGHSHLGRSTGYGSLSIWTHNLHGIEYHEDFKSESCPSNQSKPQMAVTLAAGTVTLDAVEAMKKHDIAILTGSNPTVGVAGWFPGGGHGPLSSTYGMGSDNVIEATLVTMDGKIVTANACNNTDLFWAIRGGGAGTYGILTSVVMKAYPSPKTTSWSLIAGVTDPKEEKQFYEMIADFHTYMPELKKAGLQGYYQIVGPQLGASLGAAFGLALGFKAYDKRNGSIEAVVKPFTQKLDKMGIGYQSNITTVPHFHQAFKPDVKAEPVAQGGASLGSRLLNAEALSDAKRLVEVFREIGPSADPKDTTQSAAMLGHMIANSDNKDLDTALNPAWREAVTHFIAVRGWEGPISEQMKKAIEDDVTFNKTRLLRSLAPDTGAYFNEMDFNEQDWQYSAFGKNYPRLRAIKDKYDPDGVLWCSHCVGSEDWVEDEQGKLCRPEWDENQEL